MMKKHKDEMPHFEYEHTPTCICPDIKAQESNENNKRSPAVLSII